MSVSILAIGDLSLDIIIGPMADVPGWGEEREVANVDFRLGGNLGNFAIAARVLGLEVLCAGPIGDDDNGLRIRRELEAIGCNTQLVRTVPGGATGLSIGFVRDDGERLFVTYPGVLTTLPKFVREARPPVTDVAFFSGWCQPPRIDGHTLARCFAALSAHETKIVVDLSWSTESWSRKAELLETLRHADFVLLNRKELGAIVGISDVDNGLATLTAALGDRPAVIVKRGADGAASKHGRRPIIYVSAPGVGRVSSVGAGDSFNAGFIAGTFERSLNLAQATAYACRFASHMMQTGRPKSMRDTDAPPTFDLARGS